MLPHHKFIIFTLIVNLVLIFNGCAVKPIPPSPKNQAFTQKTPVEEEQNEQSEGSISEGDLNPPSPENDRFQSFIEEENFKTPAFNQDQALPNEKERGNKNLNGIEVSQKKQFSPKSEGEVDSSKKLIPSTEFPNKKTGSKPETKSKDYLLPSLKDYLDGDKAEGLKKVQSKRGKNSKRHY